jgi:hypothetical protein
MTIFCCLIFDTPPNWRARSQYLYPPGRGQPSYTPRHLVHFRRRAAVEVFDLASTTDQRLNFFLIIYEHSVRTSQETYEVSATKANRLMLFRETVAAYGDNHTEHTDTLCRQNAEFYYVKAGLVYVTTGL